MVVISLKGGLGNQMFQYAAGLSLAKKNNSDLFIDNTWFNNIQPQDTIRQYELDCFSCTQNFIERKEIKIVDQTKRVESILKKLRNPDYFTEYMETSPKFDKKFCKLRGNVYLVGYFQSEKYFIDIRNDLLQEFKFKNRPNSNNVQIINSVRKTNSVSLHIRRGDYVSNKNASKFHGLQGLNYYKKAIKIIDSKIKDPKYFVFSDDIKWCKKNLQIENAIFVSNKNGSDDLRIMINCKHNIIANSSFSWWGAWLGENYDKVVIAPKAWFKSKHADSSDIIPSRWLRI